MKLKTLAVLVAILAVLSGMAYWANRPERPAAVDPRVGKTLVADPSAIEKAAGLRISDQGKSVSLAREAGGSWRDTSYYDFPADFSKLTSFVGDITSARVERLVTTSPNRIARLDFKGTTIEFLDSAGHSLWSVELGKNADPSGRFVRFGEDRAYLASFNAWLDTDPKDWANAAVCPVKPDDVAKIEIPFDQGGAVGVSRSKKEDPWSADRTPAGQRVAADRISSALGSLGSLRFSDTRDPADPEAAAAKQHLRTFRLVTFDGRTITIALGRKPEEKKLKAPAKPASPEAKPAAAEAKPGASDAAPADEKNAQPKPAEPAKPTEPAKPAEPEYETIPAGPVYFWITSSDAAAPVNALMKKRSFQMDDYVFTGLPQKADELFEPAPAPAPAAGKK